MVARHHFGDSVRPLSFAACVNLLLLFNLDAGFSTTVSRHSRNFSTWHGSCFNPNGSLLCQFSERSPQRN